MSHLLVPCPDRWPMVSIIQRESQPTSSEIDGIGEERSVLVLKSGGDMVMDRRQRQVTITAPHNLGPEALAHPYLSPVATMFARWFGWESFHAGGVVANGGVWALLAKREGGKSTLLAWLATRGYEIFSDDVLVVQGTNALAGPRSVDLRKRAAQELGLGKNLGVVGSRERWRVPLGPVQPELPLLGWVFLEWDSQIAHSRIAPTARLARLSEERGIRLAPYDPSRLLELVSLPAFELRRPRHFDALEKTEERLLEILY